jgi:hypothetical protein
MSNFLEVRNCKALPTDIVGSIDCEVNHDTLGWIPFTASEHDVDEKGRILYQEIIDGLHGEIIPYVIEDIRLDNTDNL